MLFSSLSFLFFFFPLVLILYYLVIYCIGRTAGNLILFCSSIFFYAWGEPQNVLILLASICFNYSIVKCIERGERFKKIYLIFSITVNLAVLFIFKYLNFTLNNLKVLGFNENIQMKEIVMPIGISFYTFQALSYLIDVYRGRVKSQNTLLGVGLYIAFFPQLVAGPIVQYQTIEEQITNRKENWDKVCQGVSRFVIGLSKKVILANSFAIVADECFENVGGGYLSLAWIGIIFYSLQIYYDFSGYSDMAVGLGKLFGFEFLENFHYPYFAASVTDFWRRWHISLGTFFREYVYIPLGGSKRGKRKTVRNLFIVWVLTGLWHGANWTFILWGVIHFLAIVLEKLLIRKQKNAFIGRLYMLGVVIAGWVFFRSDSVEMAIKYIKIMMGIGVNGYMNVRSIVLLKENFIFLIVGILGTIPVMSVIKKKIGNTIIYEILEQLSVPILFYFCCCYLIKSTYNPFIYFNF